MGPASAATASLEVALAHATRLLEAEPALAEEQATEILRAVGDHPRALHVLAMARIRQGDDQAAVGVLGPLARDCPRWAQAHADLGAALARLGRTDEAVAALRHATTLQPGLPDAWLALADALRANGDADGADAACLQHVRHAAKEPRLLAIGKALFENRLPEAEAWLRERLARAPTDVASLRMLAEVAARLGRDDEALDLLTRCLELAPGFHAARKNLAQVLNRGNRHAGHVPGARHLEWLRFVTHADSRTFLPAEELQALLDEAGLVRGKPVITYCQGGIRAAHAAFVLTLLGYEHVRVYDGSMREWANREDTPLVP